MNFFDTKYYDDNTSQTGFSQGNTLFINKVQPKTHTVNEAKEKKDEHDIGAYLANGVTSIEEVSSESGNNFFTQGNGISDSETSAVNVQEQTKLLAGFKIAYSNFTSFPNKQTAIKLKASYMGEDGSAPIIDNNHVKQLYDIKKDQIEELINS